MEVPEAIHRLIKKGALFVINDSAGKGSQAMKIVLMDLVPHEQLVIVHANLPEVEWKGNMEHIKKYSYDVPVFEVVGTKTFFEMVDHRKKFPSPAQRQCTSDLKRAPIQKFINNYAKEKGFKYVVNCMGLRAEESSSRAKKEVFRFMPSNSAKHRIQYEWLPIHDYLLDKVWATISGMGQEPHYAYGLGMSRLSCCFCIMANKNDLKIAAKHNPELAQRYIDKEEELDFTLSPNRVFLKDIINE